MYVFAEMIYDGIGKMPSGCLAPQIVVTSMTARIRSEGVQGLPDF